MANIDIQNGTDLTSMDSADLMKWRDENRAKAEETHFPYGEDGDEVVKYPDFTLLWKAVFTYLAFIDQGKIISKAIVGEQFLYERPTRT